jgi:hypothetical protein
MQPKISYLFVSLIIFSCLPLSTLSYSSRFKDKYIPLADRVLELTNLFKRDLVAKNQAYTLAFINTQQDLYWNNLDEPKLILNPDINSFFSRNKSMFSSLIVTLNLDENTSSSSVSDELVTRTLKNLTNRRKDRFIFISKNSSALKEFMSKSYIKRIQEKVGISFHNETCTYLIEDGDTLKEIKNPSQLLLESSSNNKKKPLIGYNLNGRHLRCSGSLIAPYIFAIDEPNEFKEKYDGLFYRIVSLASHPFNYTFETWAPVGQTYGTLLPNGTWLHMLADILYEDRDYDIGYNLAHAFIWDGLIDFAATLTTTKLSFITRHPQLLPLRMEAFLLPFQPSVWTAIFTTAASISMCIFLHLKFNPINRQPSIPSTAQASFISISLPIGMALEQGMRVPIGARWLSALWLWAVINVGTGYRSNLVSYLSIPMKESIPRNMDEVAARPDFKITLNVIGAVEKYFMEQSELRRVKNIRQNNLLVGFQSVTTNCVRDVLLSKNQVGCMGWDQAISLTAASSFTLEPNMEPMFLSSDGLTEVYLTLGIRKDSKYLEGLTSISYAFLESGIIRKWETEIRQIFKQKGMINMEKEKKKNSEAYQIIKAYVDQWGYTSVKPFKLDNLMVSFMLLAAGLCLSVVAFALERIVR